MALQVGGFPGASDGGFPQGVTGSVTRISKRTTYRRYAVPVGFALSLVPFLY